MFAHLDILVIVLYFVILLVVGFQCYARLCSYGSLYNYAYGHRNFITPAFLATMVATIIDGQDIIGATSEIYKKGVLFGLISIGGVVGILLARYIVESRIHYFRNCISVGDIISRSYGKRSKFVAGIVSLIQGLNSIVIQMLSLGIIFYYLLEVNMTIGILIGGSITILYSALGGIKAVIKTDILQCMILIVVLPMICNIALDRVGGYMPFMEYMLHDFDTRNFFVKEEDISYYISLFALFALPSLSPVMIQRYLIAKSRKQLVQSFNSAILASILVPIMMTVVGVVALMLYPDVHPDNAFIRVVKELVPTGLKGLAIVGLFAISSSTADSVLNISSLTVVNDVISQRYNLEEKDKIRLTVMFTFLIGVFAMYIAVHFRNLLNVCLYFFIYFAPFLTCPLIFSFFGIKSSDRVFLVSTTTTLIFVIMLKLSLSSKLCATHAILCILFNFLSLVFWHYYFHRKFQFYICDPLVKDKKRRIKFDIHIGMMLKKIFMRYDKLYGVPYMAFSIFVVIHHCFPYFVWQPKLLVFDGTMVYIYLISGIGSIVLLFHNVWVDKYRGYFVPFWYINIIFTLPFTLGFALFASNFYIFWLMMVPMTILFMTVLLDWFRSIVFFILGIVISYVFFTMMGGQLYTGMIHMHSIYVAFYIMIVCISICSIFIPCRDRKQRDTMENKDMDVKLLQDRLKDIHNTVESQLGLRSRLLNGVDQDFITPMSAMHHMLDMVYQDWNKLGEEQKHRLTLKLKNYVCQFENVVKHVSDMSIVYTQGELKLNKVPQNMTDVIRSVVDVFISSRSQLHHKHQNLVIKLGSVEGVLACFDKNEIKRVFCNIISNMIKYTVGDVCIAIDINRRDDTLVDIEIRGEDVNFHLKNSENIFVPFAIDEEDNSTELGIQFAVAEKIVKAHDGHIKISHDVSNRRDILGAVIEITMPCLPKTWHPDSVVACRPYNTIMIVDGEDVILQSLSLGLQRFGYEVVVARDGHDALELFYEYQHKIDIVITEISMSVMSGIELLNCLSDQFTKQYSDMMIYLHTHLCTEDSLLYMKKLQEEPLCIFYKHTPVSQINDHIKSEVMKRQNLYS